MVEKIHLSWEEIDALAYQAAAKIEAKFCPEFDAVYLVGIPRGGLIPAVLISHHLKKLAGKVESYLSIRYSNNTVIIDDVLDTGKTFHNIDAEQKMQNTNNISKHYIDMRSYCFLTHKIRNACFDNVLFYGQFINPDKWIVMPWEK